jgi:aminopeptidase N
MILVRFNLGIYSINANKPNLYSFASIIRILSIICFCAVLNSCKPIKQTNKTADNSTKKNLPVSQIARAEGPYQPSETLENDLIHTKLEVSFDWVKQHMDGIATLTFKPYFYPQNLLKLDAKGMDIHDVVLLPKGERLSYKYDGKLIYVTLDKQYKRADSFIVQVKYTAKPNELPKGGSKAITSDIGLYFINPLGADPNKPKQIWTQGETEASSCWFPTIDSPNEKTTQEMHITVESNYQVLTNGKFISSKVNSNGTKTEVWKQDLPHAPYLFMMAIGEFSVVKDKWQNIEVNYYVEPSYEKYAKDIFGHTPEMIQFFSNKLGYKYPWAKYSQVVVRDYVSGAMENTSATIFMEAVQSDDRALADDNWESIIAHELFHHWFGDLVTCESWSNLPLNESFANYSEYLWFEYKHGIDEADHHGENETEEYLDESTRKQVPLIRYHYLDKEDMFDRHSYNKGGRILHMLRNYVGDEAFFESLKLYLNKNQFKPVEVNHLRLAFEEVTGQDLNWFFNQWFLSPGHPELNIEHHYNSGILTITAKQLQDSTFTPIYRLPLNVDIWVNGIKSTHSIVLDKAEQNFTFPLLASPNLVLVDSDFQLLGKVSHEKSLEELAFQYKNYDRYLGRKQALLSAFNNNEVPAKNPFENPEAKDLLKQALNDPFWAIRNMALDQFYVHPISDFANYLGKIEAIAINDPKPQVRSKAINLLSSYANKEYIHVYKKAMNEKPYSVAGAGLLGYLKSGDQTIQINFTEYEKVDNISIVLPLASYYVSTKAGGKYDWFKQKLAKGSPRVIYNLIGLFVDYVIVQDKKQQEDAKLVLKAIAENNKYEQIRDHAQRFLEELNEKTKE